uniref:Uncharacterized protein n=1 Tax=Arundo donax TaxID=35708 RepID=A0A0A9APD8_ARUDO
MPHSSGLGRVEWRRRGRGRCGVSLGLTARSRCPCGPWLRDPATGDCLGCPDAHQWGGGAGLGAAVLLSRVIEASGGGSRALKRRRRWGRFWRAAPGSGDPQPDPGKCGPRRLCGGRRQALRWRRGSAMATASRSSIPSPRQLGHARRGRRLWLRRHREAGGRTPVWIGWWRLRGARSDSLERCTVPRSIRFERTHDV